MKSKRQLDLEIEAALRAGFEPRLRQLFQLAPFEGNYAASSVLGEYRPRKQDRRDPTLPKDETFTCVDRNGKVLGTSKTVAGAMQKAPNDRSYASVRGEYVSSGTKFGLGHGRRMAVRESGRWLVG